MNELNVLTMNEYVNELYKYEKELAELNEKYKNVIRIKRELSHIQNLKRYRNKQTNNE